MIEPVGPYYLSNEIGFGKYRHLPIQDVYAGSKEIPADFFIAWLDDLFNNELNPSKFSCNHIQYLEKDFLFSNLELINRNVVQKMLEFRFNNILLAEDSWSNVLNEDDAFDFDGSIANDYISNVSGFELDFINTSSKAMTEKDCEIFKFNFINEYVIMSPVIKSENWFSRDNLDYCGVLEQIVRKEFSDFIIDNALSGPGIITLKLNTGDVLMNKYYLLSGSPSYIDWALRKSEDLFLSNEYLDELEKMPVTYFSGITISKVAEDIIKWEACYKSYNYEFSIDARLKNKEKYDRYIIDNKKYNEFLKAEQREEDYRREKRRYSEQDYIDDAFGGEASAYWNID
ncbi:MAG: hypothetical protein EOP34_10300 [Rickettsiales bacterium]|nr:MAG: hypothetical protein EOP34_10300 [Rickettsiales bacterium]